MLVVTPSKNRSYFRMVGASGFVKNNKSNHPKLSPALTLTLGLVVAALGVLPGGGERGAEAFSIRARSPQYDLSLADLAMSGNGLVPWGYQG